MRKLILTLLATLTLAAVAAQAAESHGWRHGKNLSRTEIRKHPSWLKAPGHGCYHEDWGSTRGDVVAIPDEELGWIIIWKCYCEPDPVIEGDWDCQWKIVRILPDNVSSYRVRREIREVAPVRTHYKPVIRTLRGGVVFRKHARYAHCHWHNPKPFTVVYTRRR